MVAIDIDEATRNAILAALDERAARLERAVSKWQTSLGHRKQHDWPVEIEDAHRALVWNIAALHETNMARLQVAEAGEPVPTLAEAVPWVEAEKTGSYHDQQAR